MNAREAFKLSTNPQFDKIKESIRRAAEDGFTSVSVGLTPKSIEHFQDLGHKVNISGENSLGETLITIDWSEPDYTKWEKRDPTFLAQMTLLNFKITPEQYVEILKTGIVPEGLQAK